MGFFNALKGANLNFGTIDSPDFLASYLTKDRDNVFMITGTAGDFKFTKTDIKELKIVASGATWIKIKIVFNNGKLAILTSPVYDPTVRESRPAPIERFFGDLF